jgi:hypothetical protein
MDNLNNFFDNSTNQINENFFLAPIFSSMMQNINIPQTNQINFDTSSNITTNAFDNPTTNILNEYPPQTNNDNFLGFLNNFLTQRLEGSDLNNILRRTLNEKNTYKKVIDENGLNQLETIIYNSDDYPDDKTCPISFLDFKNGDEICKLPCGHIFNKESILKWLEKEQSRCPVCRFELSCKEIKNDISNNIIHNNIRRNIPSFRNVLQNLIRENERRSDEEALQEAILASLNIN